MPLVAGKLLLADRVEEGWLHVEDGKVQLSGTGKPPGRPNATGWIVPGPVNAHTHAADTFLRERPDKPRDVASLVGPGGWKHRHLAAAQPAQLADGFQSLAHEMANVGTSVFLDFREGGVAGAKLLRVLAPELPVVPRIYGRPGKPGFDEREAAELMEVCDGLGLPGMRDMKANTLESWAQAAHDAGRPVAVHVSEDKRDDIETVLALEPAFVVHMVHATPRDFQAVADAGVAVVACPRSNAYFGRKSPVAAMVASGCQVAVGTDNGMLQDGDLFAELSLAKAWSPQLSDETLLRMATHAGRRLAGVGDGRFPRRGDVADWIVLPERPIRAVSAGKPALAPVQAPPRPAPPS